MNDETRLMIAAGFRRLAGGLRTGQDLGAVADDLDELANTLEAVPEAAAAGA